MINSTHTTQILSKKLLAIINARFKSSIKDNIYHLSRVERMLNARGLHIDIFCGGGGASLGFELVTGRSPDIAINHSVQAVSMHKVNHPHTKHYKCDVREVDPVKVCKGRKVDSLWLSPDCTHFSVALGEAPVDKNIRSLPWVALLWAASVRPKVIFMENVPEIQTWGPLVAKRKHGKVVKLDEYRKEKLLAEKGEYVPVNEQALRPDKKRLGKTYRRFIQSLENLGYNVETRVLCAADYGVPTIRTRWFLIARCDGQPIVWPDATHAPEGHADVVSGKKKPWVPASSVIDWNEPAYSIFLTKEEVKKRKLSCRRPLADKTMARIAKGLWKFVIENPRPFIVKVLKKEDVSATVAAAHIAKNYTGVTGSSVDAPLGTVTTIDHNSLILTELQPIDSILPFISTYYGGEAGKDRGQLLSEPLKTITAGGGRHGLIVAHVKRDFGQSIGSSINEPLGSITAGGAGKADLVMSYITKLKGTNIGDSLDAPLHTVTAGGLHFGAISAFLVRYHGAENGGHSIEKPLGTITTKDEFGLVIVVVDGEQYVITDICMRMLTPRELYRAQGFPDWYIIEYGHDGKKFTKATQVNNVGNSVPPLWAAQIFGHNVLSAEEIEELWQEVA